MKNLKNNILFFIMGFIVFSPFSSVISFNYLHLPISLPEVLFIPFCFLLKKKIKSFRINKTSLVLMLCLFIFLLLISLLLKQYSYYAIFADARVWLYLFIAYLVFVNENNIEMNDIMYLSLGSLFGWLYVSIMGFSSSIGASDSAITYGLMLSIPMFVTLAYSMNYSIIIAIGVMVILIIFVFAAIRRIIPVFIFTILITFILSMLSKKKRYSIKKIITLVLFIIIGIIVYSIYPLIREYIREMSPSLYVRVFLRTEHFITGGIDASGDNVRFENILNTWELIKGSLFPQGFISAQTGTDKGTGIYNDYPLSQLLYIFSVWGTIIILYFFFIIIIKNIILYIKLSSPEYLLSSVTLLTMFILLFIEGTFLIYPYATPITGMMLGLAVRYSKNYNILLRQRYL